MLGINSASYIIKGNVPQVRQRLLKVSLAQLDAVNLPLARPLTGDLQLL